MTDHRATEPTEEQRATMVRILDEASRDPDMGSSYHHMVEAGASALAAEREAGRMEERRRHVIARVRMINREYLGMVVRRVWIDWAREQPNPKPSWLVPWEELSEPDREVDRRIGETLCLFGKDMEDLDKESRNG